MSILEEHSIYAKMSKCEFGMKEMLYLGHVINAEGVQVDMEKIRAITLSEGSIATTLLITCLLG